MNIFNFIGILSLRSFYWDILCRLVVSMLDVVFKDIRDVVIGEMIFRGNLSEEVKLVNNIGIFRLVMVSFRDEICEEILKDLRKIKSYGIKEMVFFFEYLIKDIVLLKVGMFEEFRILVFLYEWGSRCSSLYDFLYGEGLDFDGRGYLKVGGLGCRDLVDWDRSKDLRECDVCGYRGLVFFYERDRG